MHAPTTHAPTMTDVPRAEAALAAARAAEADASTLNNTAAEALRLALDAKGKADAAASKARADLDAASARRAEAEAAWSAGQASPGDAERWRAVEAARTVEAQAQVRAVSAASLAAAAEGEAAVAARRAERAADALRRAALTARTADLELRGARTSAAALDAEEARRRGLVEREREEAAAVRATFIAEAQAAIGPPLARYVAALGQMRAAEAEIAAALPAVTARGKHVANLNGVGSAPPADLDLRAGLGPMLREAATRKYGRDPWGEGPTVLTGAPRWVREREREGETGPGVVRNVFHAVVDAGLRPVAAPSAPPPAAPSPARAPSTWWGAALRKVGA